MKVVDWMFVSTTAWMVSAFPESVVGLDHVEQQVNQCLADPATQDKVDKLLNACSLRDAAGTTTIPGVPNDGKPPYEWFANVLPDRFHPNNVFELEGLPQTPTLSGFADIPVGASNWGYPKELAYDLFWLLFMDIDPRNATSNHTFNTIFGMNLQDRGPNNLMKKQYMSALTCHRMPLYQKKLTPYINNFIHDITILDKPVLSSWSNRSLQFFWDVHLGDTNPPHWVRDYMDLFIDLQAPGTTSYIAGQQSKLRRASCLSRHFRHYVTNRTEIVVKQKLNDTFVFYWNTSGLPSDMYVGELVHNFIAWRQFVNILFRVIRAKLQGFETLVHVNDTSLTIGERIDFFDLFQKVNPQDSAEQLNVVREAFRMLLPAGDFFSQFADRPIGSNNTVSVTNMSYPHKTSQHFPLYIQAMNDNMNPQTLETDHSVFDTSRYVDFHASKCPMLQKGLSVQELFTTSDIDDETIVPRDHPEFFPVYAAGNEPPSSQRSGKKITRIVNLPATPAPEATPIPETTPKPGVTTTPGSPVTGDASDIPSDFPSLVPTGTGASEVTLTPGATPIPGITPTPAATHTPAPAATPFPGATTIPQAAPSPIVPITPVPVDTSDPPSDLPSQAPTRTRPETTPTPKDGPSSNSEVPTTPAPGDASDPPSDIPSQAPTETAGSGSPNSPTSAVSPAPEATPSPSSFTLWGRALGWSPTSPVSPSSFTPDSFSPSSISPSSFSPSSITPSSISPSASPTTEEELMNLCRTVIKFDTKCSRGLSRLFRNENVDLKTCQQLCERSEDCNFFSFARQGPFAGFCMGCKSANDATTHTDFAFFPVQCPRRDEQHSLLPSSSPVPDTSSFPSGISPTTTTPESQLVTGPKYCPFGLGYRRCPAEYFNLFILQNLISAMAQFEFEIRSNKSQDLFDLVQYGDGEFNKAISLGKERVRDIIFIKQPSTEI